MPISIPTLVAHAMQAPPTSAAPSGVVSVSPSSAGLPGAGLIQQMLGWLSQLALWGSLASILAGAAVVAFAFKRLDEEDFETEFELDEPSEDDDVIVIHEN